jgi:amino acid adenylation domain-containing protein
MMSLFGVDREEFPAGCVNGHRATFRVSIPHDLEAILVSSAATQHFEECVLLLTVFQELLRRYTGQPGVTVSVHLDQVPAHDSVLSLSDRLSVLQSALQAECEAQSATVSSHQTIAVDGSFSFQRHCGILYQTRARSSSPIHLSFYRSESALEGLLEFDSTVWPESRVPVFSTSYLTLLRSALSHLEAPLGELEALTAAEKSQLVAWNRTEAHYPRLRADQLFEQRAAETPDSVALTFEGASLTYRSLSRETGQLALRLRSMGVGPGALVGVCMERSNEMVAALVAIFKAGAAYLPLDPAFPAERIQFMLEDARPILVVTQSHLAAKFPFGNSPTLAYDAIGEMQGTASLSNLPLSPESDLDDLAYVLYTSGSTGKPKGVEITHRALTNLLTSVSPSLPLTASDVFLATSTISFDISVFEIFAPLAAGARLVIAPRSVTVSGELLADAIATNGITVLQATPSGWRVLLEAGFTGQSGLKMLTAGEPLDLTLASRLLERGESLWNLYGPTEATIYATGSLITKEQTKIRVGRPLSNYAAYVLDHAGRNVPLGAIGELYLGGVGVARGYLSRPALTSEKFVADSFSGQPGGRLYRTGDLARFEQDGQIELLGRADNQIKLRGYRIELEEIEAVLDSHPDVRKSVAKVLDLGEGDQRLAAYIVPRSSNVVDEARLRAFALGLLPSYMVPTAYISMAAFTLTPNGKVDRKALPTLPFVRSLEAEVSSDGSFDELERAVLDSWQAALNVPNLLLDQNFFELGGHSLLAVRIVTEVGDRLALKLPISLLLEAPTARTFANRIRNFKRRPLGCLVPIQTMGTQPTLYMVHHLLGDVLIYRTLADCFAPDRRVFGVQPPSGLTKRGQPCTLASLASEYVSEILENQNTGPYHLAGFSSGSVLAYEMARQLEQAGHTVGLLALIDGDVKAPGQAALSRFARYRRMLTRKLCKIAFKFRDEVAEGPRQFVVKRLRYLFLLWQIRNLKASATGARELSLEQTLILAEGRYDPGFYAGSALLLRFQDEAWQFGPDPLMGWSTLVRGNLEVVDFPGGHITGMSPARAPQLANLLRSRMECAETAIRVAQAGL